jgi:AcrR family transcriptional regulator
VLVAARHVFQERGYAAATIEAVAARAGVSIPTVYSVFRSKAGLLSELVADAGSDPKIRQLADRAMATKDPRERLAAAARVVRAIMQGERAILDVLREAGGGRPELQAARLQVHRQQRNALAGAVRPLHEAGVLRHGMTLDEAVATFSALASPETYWLLVDELDWSAAKWERWLATSTARLLLS